MDQKKPQRSKDRNAQQPQNGQLMTELKYLKAQLVIKDKRIKELEGTLASALIKIKDLEAVAAGPVAEIVKVLETEAPSIEKLVAANTARAAETGDKLL